MIRTWITDVSCLADEEKCEKCYEALPQHRKEKADRIKKQEGRFQSIGAGILLERMKAFYGTGEEVVYNLSHSGNYALCSIDDDLSGKIQLGCDMETIKDYRQKVAKHFFTEREYASIEACGTLKEKEELFYRYWVLKESFMKATRLGMALSPKLFEIGLTPDRAVLLERPKQFQKDYYYYEYKMKGIEACIAVCADVNNFDREIHLEIL